MNSSAFDDDDDDDVFLLEEENFSNYVASSYQPGWSWTYYIIFICILINCALPILLLRAKRRDEREKRETELAKNPAATPKDPKKGFFDGEEAASVVSASRSLASSAVMSQVASSLLDQKVNKGVFHRHQTRKRRARRVIKAENRDGNDDAASESQSVMGKLEEDAISVRDAVDADDPTKQSPTGENLTVGERIVDSSTWDKEMKKIVSLWVPYSISGAADGLSQIVNFAIISHHIGPQEANAYVTVVILTEFTDVFTYGFAEAVGVLGPQADGVGNDVLVGRYMQLGFIFYTLATIPGLILWSSFTEDVVMWFGFDEETARIAQGYAYPLLAMGFFEGAGEVLDAYLEFMDHERFAMFMTILAAIAESLVVLFMALAGIKDLVLVGIVQALISFLIMVAIISFVLYKGWLDDVWEGLALSWGLNDRQAVKNMIKTAIPMGISYLLTYGEWEIMTLFAAHMGPAEVAAWGILGFLWDTFEYAIDGLSDAAEVRVAFRMGSGETQLARASAYKGMYLAIVISVYATSLLFLISGNLPQWLTPDPTLQRMIFETLPLIGFGQVLMSVGMVCWNIIEAQGRVRLATTVEFVTSWVLVMPASAVLVYGFNYNLLGMVGPLVVGYSIGCVAIIYILLRSDWESLSMKVIAMNGGNLNFDEYDWDDLPERIQKAASVLGYTEEMWDNDKEPASSDKGWSRLAGEEKDAARKLGFNKQKWDSDNSGVTEEEGRSLSTHYDDFDWAELPFMIQQAARVIGYTSSMWDADKEPKTCDKDWTELTPEEHDAALKLGYDQMKWDGDSDSDSEDATKSTLKIYDKFDWKHLPRDVHKAAEVLGYTQSIWDGNKEPASCSRSWHKLAMAERIAAKKLGYDVNSWNGGGSDNNAADKSASKALSDPSSSKLWDDSDWDELPDDIKKAARVLEFTAKIWDTNKEPKSSDKDWKELTTAEQEAAEKLGHNQREWDSDGDSAPVVNYDDLTWRKLPVNVQEAAKVLGYTPKMWNNDQEPDTCDKDWDDLNSKEQEAALKLGYDKKRWENGSEGNGYDDLTWRKLPVDVQEAAKALGYTPKMWNNDQEPDTCDKDWKGLSDTERQAAEKLGYNKHKWGK